MEVYLVGGVVRDKLLGLPIEEIGEPDWMVTGASAEEMLDRGYRPVGKDFPVFLHPRSNEAYALARTEKKQGRGYYGFQVHAAPDVSLEEDLRRRDLTINAMARDQSGKLIDPYGGQQDLHDKLLRHVSSAFTEDPLRVLRVARFAAKFASRGFRVADETLQLMRHIARSGELTELTPERIWQETRTALSTETPTKFFSVLHETRTLEQIFTGIGEQFSNQQARNIGFAALDEISLREHEPCARFAALVGGLYFYRREDARHEVDKLINQIPLPDSCKKLLTLTATLQHQCHEVFALRARHLLGLLNRLDVSRKPERFVTALKIFSAIYTAATGEGEYLQAAWLRRAANAITNINAGKWVRAGIAGAELANKLQHARLESLRGLIQDHDTTNKR